METIRENGSVIFSEIFKEMQRKASSIEIELKKTRLVPNQIHRSDGECAGVESYDRITVFIPLLDCFVSELKSRFEIHKSIVKGFDALIPKNAATASNGPSPSLFENVKNLVKHYFQDIEKDPNGVEAELKLWYSHLSQQESQPRDPLHCLVKCNRVIFPSIYNLLKILATLPVTTCTSERSFSTLRRLKSCLRSTSGQVHLNGLALLNIYRDMAPTPEQVA